MYTCTVFIFFFRRNMQKEIIGFWLNDAEYLKHHVNTYEFFKTANTVNLPYNIEYHCNLDLTTKYTYASYVKPQL